MSAPVGGHEYLDGTLIEFLRSGPKRLTSIQNWARKRGVYSVMAVLRPLVDGRMVERFRAFDGYFQYRLQCPCKHGSECVHARSKESSR